MSGAGKGDRPRPSSVPLAVRDRNHDDINWKSKAKKRQKGGKRAG